MLQWFKKNYRKVIMAYVQIAAVFLLISNLHYFLDIGTFFAVGGTPNPSEAGPALLMTVIMLVLSVLTALICFLSSKVFAKELRRAFVLIALGITIISAGYFLEIESALGFALFLEVTAVSKSFVGVAGFFMIFAGLYYLYKKSLEISRTVTPYRH